MFSECSPVCECLNDREREREREREKDGEREKKRERVREDTSARDLGPGDFTFCQERETKKERGSECETDMARLKYTDRVQHQPKILLLTSQYCVSITFCAGLMQHHHFSV